MDFQADAKFHRDHFIYFLVLSFFVALFVKAIDIQIFQSDFLQAEGNKRQIRTLEIPAPRGKIYDRNGNILSLSTPYDSVWVDPKILSFYLDKTLQKQSFLSENLTAEDIEKRQQRIDEKRLNYQKMLALLNVAENTLTPKILSKKQKRFLYVKRSIRPELSKQIERLDVPGIYVQNEYKRYYPAGEVLGHVTGFTNIDDQGISGIEKTYNQWLVGQSGKKQVIKDRAGRVIEFVKDIQPAQAGQDLTLSIDKDIQFFLHHALKKAYIKHQARSAQSVILDAKTGEILAMSTVPAFNPNNRSQLTGERLRNRVIADRIEPGSTIKPFVIAKGLDLGLIDETTEINTHPGSIRVQGQRISDTRNNGILTPAGIVGKSSNVGMVKVAFRMTPRQQWQMMQDLGFGQDLGLFLPGETLGFVRPVEEWQKIDQASASFGYGFNVNLLQLARAYTIFANQGMLKPVTLLKHDPNKQQQTEQDDNFSSQLQPKPVIDALVAEKVLRMMEAVAKRGGTAPKAKIEGYRIAGKTGTVHKTKIGGYEQNQYVSLFVGMVPASDPKYIMATAVNEPSRGVYFGGLVAAPVFKEVMQEVLRLKNIPPDESIADRKAS